MITSKHFKQFTVASFLFLTAVAIHSSFISVNLAESNQAQNMNKVKVQMNQKIAMMTLEQQGKSKF